MATMSPLRRRMIEDMTVRNLSPATQRSYIHAVAKFSRFFGRSPDRLGLEDVRAFQVHLVSNGISWPALNQTVCALRFGAVARLVGIESGVVSGVFNLESPGFGEPGGRPRHENGYHEA
jgi:Phage integrase, N-terminal SAM-like domain